MSNENRTLADWPVGTTGKTTGGHYYTVMGHGRHGLVLMIEDVSGHQWSKMIGPDAPVLIHPDDERISIMSDLTNPDRVPWGKLDEESKQALYAHGWRSLERVNVHGRWVPSLNDNEHHTAADIPPHMVYRLRPQPKTRPMTHDEAREWANKQPENIVVQHFTEARNADYYSYAHPAEHYRWADVDKGGGWQPLPMVEDNH